METYPQLMDWNLQIFASDVAGSVLDRARSGFFSQVEAARGLSPEMLRKWFVADP